MDGQRVEVHEELRSAAAAVRREVAGWTGATPANVPMHWPSAGHLFQTQANMQTREVGGQPLYQWGQVTAPEPEPTPPTVAPVVFDQAAIDQRERIKAAPRRQWPAPIQGLE